MTKIIINKGQQFSTVNDAIVTTRQAHKLAAEGVKGHYGRKVFESETTIMYELAEEIYPVENAVVKKLNANVATATFTGKGEQLADLYSSPNECPVLVAHGTCAPANGTFERTVKIVLP